jgi:ABC-type phosphate transport system substrate-binding protein
MVTRTGPSLSRAVLSIFLAAALCAAAASVSSEVATDVAGAAPVVAPDTSRFAVVVNASRPATLRRRQVAELFLKRAPRWPDGTRVEAVDLSVNDSTRAAFSKAVLEQSTAGVVHYWQQQMLTGRIVPPLVKSEEGLLAFVAATPGGIGYVGSGATLPEGVKVVKLVE